MKRVCKIAVLVYAAIVIPFTLSVAAEEGSFIESKTGLPGVGIGGSVTGLSGTVVLQNNGGDNLSLSDDGSFTFSTSVLFGQAYKVTVLTQPTGQVCEVTNGSGTTDAGPVNNVLVTCADLPGVGIGGTVTGLSGTVVLQNNGGDNLSLSDDGSFTFSTSVPFGQAYEVTVLTQPAGQICEVTNGSGTTVAEPVTDVLVTCADHHTLEEVVIEGEAYSAPGVSTIGAESLQEAANVNVADVLNDEPDISLSRRGRIGDCSDSLSIRGFSGNRILLNINGRPINSAGVGGGYYIDWNTISLDNVEKVEIIRGGSSARYSNTLGGVVNVITKTAPSKPETTFFANYGTGDISNMYTLRATNSYKTGPLGYSIGANYQKADAFLWNNDFERKNANLNTTFDLPTHGDLSFGFRYSNTVVGLIRNNRAVDQDSGDPEDPNDPGYNIPINPGYPPVTGVFLFPTVGHAFIPGTGSNTEKTTMLYDMGWNQPIGEGLLDAKVYWNDEEMRDRNYASCDIVWFSGNTCRPGVEGALVLDQETETDRSRGGRIDFSYPFDFGSLLGAHELGVGVERHEVRFGDKVYNYFDPDWNSTSSFYPSDYPGYSPSSEGINHGCYLEDEWWVSDRISLMLGLRFDHFHNKPLKEGSSKAFTEWALTPKATGIYSFRSGNSITASVHQAFRAPGQPEIYWWSNPQIFPGGSGLTLPEGVLKAEKSKAIELTYQHPLDIGKVRLAGWYYRVDDYLMLRFDPRAYISYNIKHADLYGLSADMRLDVTRWLSVNASVAFQKTGKSGDFLDPENDLDGIDYIPEWKAFAGADIKLPHDSQLSINTRYIGEREALYLYGGFGRTEKQTVVEVDDYILVDLRLKIPIEKHVVLGLYVENIIDTAYEERFGFPMPGRMIGADVKASF